MVGCAAVGQHLQRLKRTLNQAPRRTPASLALRMSGAVHSWPTGTPDIAVAAANQIESRPPGRRRRGAGTLPAPGSMDQDFALDSCRGTLPLAGKRRINSRFPNNQHATIGVSARVSLFLAASQLQSHITLARGRTSDSPRLAGPGSLGACSLFRRPARRACVCPDCHLTGNQNGMEE